MPNNAPKTMIIELTAKALKRYTRVDATFTVEVTKDQAMVARWLTNSGSDVRVGDFDIIGNDYAPVESDWNNAGEIVSYKGNLEKFDPRTLKLVSIDAAVGILASGRCISDLVVVNPNLEGGADLVAASIILKDQL